MDKVKGYAFSTVVDLSFGAAVDRVKEALKGEDFGVITEIDIKDTLKKKLGVKFRNYVILGACNPPYAHKALRTDLDMGLLLPCNVIVYETDDGKIRITALNPVSLLEIIENEELRNVAEEISEKLRRVTASLER
jgi:uncharacterized protein (DUF302 family)